jgi:hypothetical protein
LERARLEPGKEEQEGWVVVFGEASVGGFGGGIGGGDVGHGRLYCSADDPVLPNRLSFIEERERKTNDQHLNS